MKFVLTLIALFVAAVIITVLDAVVDYEPEA
jgi:hypothetical protein